MTRVALVPDQLRRVAGTLKDAASEGRVIAGHVLHAPMPEMPAGVAGAIQVGVDNVARTLSAQAPALMTAEEELRVRALWGDIADAQSECRNLSDAQLNQLYLFMGSGALLRYGVTPEQAEYAGRMLASRYRETFEDPAKLRELADLLRPNAANADFAGGFIDSFGARNFAEIPRVLQAMEHPWSIAYGNHLVPGGLRTDIAARLADNPDYDGDTSILDLLAPFSQALAVATYGNTLSRDRQREIATDPDQWAVASLLSHEGKYGKDFLLDVFRTGVVERIINDNHSPARGLWDEGLTEDSRIPLGWTSDDGGLARDPKAIILAALARNEDAAAAALTTDIPAVELSRLIDSERVRVTDPLQLLLEFGTYGDKGVALGEASASAVSGLHGDGRGGDANQITERLIHEVIRGERADLDGIADGLARVVATPGIMENLHAVAALPESGSDYDRDHDGLVGSSDEDGIRLSSSQLRDLLGELSDRDLARERLLDGIRVHQTNEILAATGPSGPDNGQWASEIGNFNGLLADANNDERLEDLEDRRDRHEQIFGAIDSVTGLVPMGDAAGFITDQALDAFKDGTAPDGQAVLDENYNVSQEMRGRMDAAIVSGFYEHGAFGSPQDIEAQINRLDSPGYDVKSFLDASGHIIPYDKMDDDQRSTFGDWMRSDRVQDVVHESLQSAGNGVDARVRQ